MKAGDLDRRITLQAGTPALDAAGDPIMSWADAFKRWAKKRERGTSQGEGVGSILRQVNVEFTVRDDSQTRTIAPERFRILYDGRTYTINGITEAEDGRHRYFVISCATRPDLQGTMARGSTNVPNHD